MALARASPIFGSAFVELNSGYYPHNVLLEAGMSVGVPLALVFLFVLMVAAHRAWTALNSSAHLLVGLLFFQAAVGAMISDSLFGGTVLWVTTALLLGGTTSRHGRSVLV